MQKTGNIQRITHAKLISLVLLVTCSVMTLHAHATLDLNGVAIHSELGKDQYMAALYLEELDDNAKNILLSDQRKRMEIKVVANRLLSRKFKRQWIEGVAINAGNNELKKHAQNLADFSNMLKLKLIRDDTLTIERTFRRGVEVSINGVQLGTIEDTTFFDLLLRAWIGPVPPSTQFKGALLGKGSVEPNLLARFESVRTTADRVSALEAALAGAAAIAAAPTVTATVTAGGAKATQKAESAAAPQTATAPEQAKANEPTPSTPASEETPDENTDAIAATNPSSERQATETTTENTETESTATEETTEVASAIADATASSDQTTEDPLADELLSTATLGNTILAEDEDIFDEEEEDDFSYTAADLLSRQLYISKLTRWTRGYVKYPNTALRKNQQGSVRITVIIDRDGKVKSSEVTAKSEYSSLNKAAIKAVKKASPYPAMPDIIKGDTFTFTVPIAFNLR